MKLKIYPLGAAGEVGRSAFILDDGREPILLDYGTKIIPKGGIEEPLPFPIIPHHAIISHAHLDHIGSLPKIFEDFSLPWYTTPPSYDIGEVLWEDAIKLAKLRGEETYTRREISKAFKHWHPLIYNVEEEIGHIRVKLYDASHISGSAMVELSYGEKTFLYTGDFKGEPTQLHKGAHPREADVLMIEATYWDRDHPPRRELEEKLMDEIRETLDNGGNVLLPAFALGRTQELIKVIRSHDRNIPVYVDGMGVKISRIYAKFPGFIDDFVGFERALKQVTLIDHPKQREKPLKEPSVIISTAGMLDGGPALHYITRLNPQSKIIITGFCVEGSNGRTLLDNSTIEVDGYKLHIDLPVEYLDFSAHAGRSEIINFIEKSNAEKVLLVHSDNPKAFEDELRERGFDALALSLGKPEEITF